MNSHVFICLLNKYDYLFIYSFFYRWGKSGEMLGELLQQNLQHQNLESLLQVLYPSMETLPFPILCVSLSVVFCVWVYEQCSNLQTCLSNVAVLINVAASLFCVLG